MYISICILVLHSWFRYSSGQVRWYVNKCWHIRPHTLAFTQNDESYRPGRPIVMHEDTNIANIMPVQTHYYYVCWIEEL